MLIGQYMNRSNDSVRHFLRDDPKNWAETLRVIECCQREEQKAEDARKGKYLADQMRRLQQEKEQHDAQVAAKLQEEKKQHDAQVAARQPTFAQQAGAAVSSAAAAVSSAAAWGYDKVAGGS
jgi:hypothetical protein